MNIDQRLAMTIGTQALQLLKQEEYLNQESTKLRIVYQLLIQCIENGSIDIQSIPKPIVEDPIFVKLYNHETR